MHIIRPTRSARLVLVLLATPLTATATLAQDIRTGKNTILNYLLEPILRIQGDALTQR